MTLLQISDLTITLPGAARPVLDQVTLRVQQGETVGLVGESGSGKSVTCRAVLGQLPPRAQALGTLAVGGEDVLAMNRRSLRRLRAKDAAMVFQDPRAAVDPLHRVGHFLTESMRINLGYDGRKAEARASDLLREVNIADPVAALRRWPHEFSGGMLQRVVIAAALAGDPRLLLADEATTALDVTTQAEVVALLQRLAAERKMGILFVTHDLELAAAMCDRVYVMYAGQVVEAQTVDDLFDRPLHPYTAALLAATPRVEGSSGPPRPIVGRPLGLDEAATGCPFASRCPYAEARCETEYSVSSTPHLGTTCVRSEELADVLRGLAHDGEVGTP